MALYGLPIKPEKVIITEEAKQLARLAAHARRLKHERKTSTSQNLYPEQKK